MKLRTKILLITLLPIILLGVGIYLLAADRIANGIYDQAYAGMEAAALAVRDIFEIGNAGAYQVDENGELWKGDNLNISQSTDIVDHIKDSTGMDVTIFWNDTRILTSIKNDSGERQNNSKASDAVIQTVLKNGEYYLDRNVDILGTQYIVCYIPIYQENTTDTVGMIFLGTPRAKVSALINEIRLQMLAIVLIVLLLTGLLLIKLVNSIIKALMSCINVLQKISEGDLTVEPDACIIQRSDEIGMFGKEIMALRSHFLEIIEMLQLKSLQLDKESAVLKNRSEQILQVMHGLDSAAQDMSVSCTTQADNAGTASSGVSAMGDMIDASNSQIRQIHQISNHIQSVSDHTAAELAELTKDMETVRSSIDYLEHQTSLTKDSVDQISRATELISAIASQTSLLSLNASIESARAGELGKGFGVVAAEIQKLSVQANTAVDDIRTMVDSLIHNSAQAMECMAEVHSVIQNQEQNIHNTGEAFESVKENIQISAEHMDAAIQKTDEMEEIRTHMVAAVQNSAAAAQENAATVEEMTASVISVYNELQIITMNAKQLGELSSEMKQSIEIFKTA